MSSVNKIKINRQNQSKRITFNNKQTYLNVKLDNTIESLDVLSLKLFQKDLYKYYDSNYGIIVGRVVANGGTGVPNCRISVFIPVEENNLTEIKTLEDLKVIQSQKIYPFKTPTDVDSEGKIYNLLPKFSRNRYFNNFPDNEYGIGATPKTPVGSFNEQEQIVSNETLLEVYQKYFKYSTLTNESGDYILIVPSNTEHQIIMNCDITDIGKYSMSVSQLKTQGASPSFFDENGTLIIPSNDITKLPNIDIQTTNLFVKPLWTQDTDKTDYVGINRLDFNISKRITPYSTIVGNHITPKKNSWWGDTIIFRLFFGIMNFCQNIININANCMNQIDTPGLHYIFNINLNLPLGIGRVPIVNKGTLVATSICTEEPLFRIGIKLIIKNILPFFNVILFRNRYCTLKGGKGNYNAFDVVYLGKTGTCDRNKALMSLGELSDDLFINSHTTNELDMKVFSLSNQIPDVDADRLNNDLVNDTDEIYQNYDYTTDINLLPDSRYTLLQENGQFILILPCNRKKVITNEFGREVEVPFDNPNGIFTEFRGYLYIKNNQEPDNPAYNKLTSNIRLKIPQLIDYSTSNIKWIWKHYKFELNKIYSVAQLINVKNPTFTKIDESTDDDGIDPTSDLGSTVSIAGELIEGPTLKGYDEQTGILFTGIFEDDNPEIPYIRNANTDNNYTDFYNHITFLGDDLKDEINLESLIDEIPQQPPVLPPPPPDYSLKKINTYLYSETTLGNNTTTYFDLNDYSLGLFNIKAKVSLGFDYYYPPNNWNFTLIANDSMLPYINTIVSDGVMASLNDLTPYEEILHNEDKYKAFTLNFDTIFIDLIRLVPEIAGTTQEIKIKVVNTIDSSKIREDIITMKF